jgi:phosphoribosylamine---glycine ligase
MRVLVIGSGGREHALVWALRQSQDVTPLCAPGNPGIAASARCLPHSALDIGGLAETAEREGIDLTIVGPEAPLASGIVDTFAKRGLRAFGPTQHAAVLEASKAFMKTLCQRYDIPTAPFQIFEHPGDAIAHVRRAARPVVVKADGLAGGKGVVVASTVDEGVQAIEAMMVARRFGEAGARVVIEEVLQGEEVSVLALCDGTTVSPLLPVQDYKRLRDGDRGPNTGGMGSYAPAAFVDQPLLDRITDEVLEPVVWAMAQEGRPYRGVLYAGLMLTAEGPQVLEFNVRLGDPETQAMLPLLQTDLCEALEAVVAGHLDGFAPQWRAASCVCVVLCADGYPDSPRTGQPIAGLEDAQALPDVLVFHAGTGAQDGKLVTAGGRVLNVVAVGRTGAEATRRAYAAAEMIQFEGKVLRYDIGAPAAVPLMTPAASGE